MELIYPDWEAPSHIKAFSTTRVGEDSFQPFSSFNFASYIEGDKNKILTDRTFLKETLQLPSKPLWLNHIHGIQLSLDQSRKIEADGAITVKKNKVLVVRTGDCLPVFLTDIKGTFVSVLHAGWRGLASGIITEAIKHISTPASELLVHLGPCISGDVYEVDQDVYDAFTQTDKAFEAGFKPIKQHKYYLDLHQCATIELENMGAQNITRYKGCTFKEKDKFYSYRRNQKGRMAHFIYINCNC